MIPPFTFPPSHVNRSPGTDSERAHVPGPSDDDDGITGFTFEDLAGADAEDAIAALVMTALAVTGPSEWRRAVSFSTGRASASASGPSSIS